MLFFFKRVTQYPIKIVYVLRHPENSLEDRRVGLQEFINSQFKQQNIDSSRFTIILNSYTKSFSEDMLLKIIMKNTPKVVRKATNQEFLTQFSSQSRIKEIYMITFLRISILEKTFKLLSDNIFQTCSIINLNGSLPQQLSTLLKLFVFTEQFAKKTKENKKLYREQKIFQKNDLQVLDLSKVKNYNRHDLAEKLLINTVFTEFSNIEKLHVYNFDVGRCQAYYKAKRKFLDYIKQKQNEDPFYKTLKHSLKHIVFPQQSYRMEIETMKEFFLDYLF